MWIKERHAERVWVEGIAKQVIFVVQHTAKYNFAGN